MRFMTAVVGLTATLGGAAVAEPGGYRMPPQKIVDLLDARPDPRTVLSPDRKLLMILEQPALPPLAELARPELRLAGLRLDPRTNGPSRDGYHDRLTLHVLASGVETPVSGLPAAPRIRDETWSPDGAHFAFSLIEAEGISLWVGDSATGRANRLVGPRLDAAYGSPCDWDGSAALVCKLVPADRGALPAAPTLPAGPIIQENLGKKTPARTNPDFLKSATDEDQLDYLLRSEIVRVKLDGATTRIGAPATYLDVSPSPSGEYLLVETLRRPYSYTQPIDRFPFKTEIWDLNGKVVSVVADLPLADAVPIDFDAVRSGPRDVSWRADAPAEACWFEALDGGDARAAAAVRDELRCLRPGDAQPRSLAKLALRGGRVIWGNDHLAMVTESWWETRREHVWIIAPGAGQKPRLLFDRSSEDRYGDPGQPALRRTPSGTQVMATLDGGRSILLFGRGASPDGDLPFVDKLDLASGQSQRLWRAAAQTYEAPLALLDDAGARVLTLAESVVEPPNLYVRGLGKGGARAQVTHFANPSPELAKVHKELIHYQRADGVKLAATLYLPPGYQAKRDGPLPVLMWVYPAEFKTANAASQVIGSPFHFTRVLYWSPLFALFDGYAVVDDPSMPIVGEGAVEPNDTYVQQLTADAQAAVDEVVRLGVGDRERIAVGGHSYGAFTTANLLAHTTLFRAGIAESGAYNRTLTPFGFQSEERDFWTAPRTYMDMSPFAHAGDIHDPLLLIHGQADDNQGTFTIQSERMYDALKGLGATVRLVLLPLEKHGYQARESILHLEWERLAWLDKYVKHATPRATK